MEDYNLLLFVMGSLCFGSAYLSSSFRLSFMLVVLLQMLN